MLEICGVSRAQERAFQVGFSVGTLYNVNADGADVQASLPSLLNTDAIS